MCSKFKFVKSRTTRPPSCLKHKIPIMLHKRPNRNMAESGPNVDKQSEGSSVSDTINKQGWLSKRSRLSKRWDRRWCCLRKSDLSYGATAEDQHKVVSLEGCEMSDCNIDKKQFAFRIKPRGAKRVYFFCAESEQDQQEWMQAICFAKASGNMGDGSLACTIQ